MRRTALVAALVIVTGCGAGAVSHDATPSGSPASGHTSTADQATVQAKPVPARTVRVSLSSTQQQANLGSYDPAISSDGRYVAFVSSATNLVPGDTNTRDDVFLKDTKTGRTTRLNTSSGGAQGNGIRIMPPSVAMDSSGRYVVFESDDQNLVAGDTNACTVMAPGTQPCPDIFLRDLKAGTIRRVSVTSTGQQANGLSYQPTISADGRYVAFSSGASNLVPGDTNNAGDIFVRDLKTSTIRRASLSGTGGQADQGSGSPSISADGRYVAFVSRATTLAPGNSDHAIAVFVHDMTTGKTRLVGKYGQPIQDETVTASISANGRYVVFTSRLSLVPSDTDQVTDAYRRDLKTGALLRVSGLKQDPANPAYSRSPVISANGRYVAYAQSANGAPPILLRDMVAGTTRTISVPISGKLADGDGFAPAISATGRYVAFASAASDLVPGDTNQQIDIFVRGPLN